MGNHTICLLNHDYKLEQIFNPKLLKLPKKIRQIYVSSLYNTCSNKLNHSTSTINLIGRIKCKVHFPSKPIFLIRKS